MNGSSWRARLRWLPNAITISRLAGIPVLVALIATAEGRTSTAVAVWFAVIAGTDFIDGHLARFLKAETRFGRIADPLADRLVMAVGLVGLLVMERVAWPGPVAILVRDGLAVAAFVVLARKGVEMRVDWAGKTSSTLAMVGTGMCLLNEWPGADIVFWIAVAFSILTLINYARTARGLRRASAST